MKVNWKIKSKAFKVIDRFHLESLLYFVQKNVTRHSRFNYIEPQANWLFHEKNLEKLKSPRLIEIGAGKNLAQNIYLSKLVAMQTVVDLNPMLDLAQVNQAALQISKFEPGVEYRECSNLVDLKEAYSIDYQAPFDMSEPILEADSFDCSVSTNTMEHIPPTTLVKIIQELKRLIRNNGVLSVKIDYSDHYANTDPSIGHLNFLAFSDEEWAEHNHESHYLNRLRHYDYVRIFEEAGFQIEKSEPVFTIAIPEKIDSRFRRDDPTVHATSGRFLIRVQK